VKKTRPTFFTIENGQKLPLIKPQTTDVNLCQPHCLALREPTLDFLLKITRSKKLEILGFI
jgi:hypothetical protein